MKKSDLRQKFRSAACGLLVAAAAFLTPGFNQKAVAQVTLPSVNIKIESLSFLPPATHADKKWKLKLYASHAFTHYFSSSLSVKTSQYDATIRGYAWEERRGDDFFTPNRWFPGGGRNAQFIDEPTNTYTLAVEKNADVIVFSMFHPKFATAPGQERHIQGLVNGTVVDGIGWIENAGPPAAGKMNIESNQNTYMSLEFEAGYARIFCVLASRKFGKIHYVPGLSAGVQTGQTFSSTRQADGTIREYKEPESLQGFGGSVRNKLEWTSRNQRLGVFYENKLSLYHRDHALLDGRQKYNLAYTSNNFGFSAMLYNPNKRGHKHKTG